MELIINLQNMSCNEKINLVWSMYSVNLENYTIYNIFTKAGNYRWWKKYFNDKKVIILSWKVKVLSFEDGNDIEKLYSSWDIFSIKSWIPHIFYFEEDSEIIEFFPKNTKTEKFKKYYNLK
jgi:hypothetical protein